MERNFQSMIDISCNSTDELLMKLSCAFSCLFLGVLSSNMIMPFMLNYQFLIIRSSDQFDKQSETASSLHGWVENMAFSQLIKLKTQIRSKKRFWDC